MSHYLNIQLQLDPELASHQLLSGLYARLHRALVQLDSHDIGIGFPSYDERKPSLGNRVRLHGPELALQRLMATSWLNGMFDHLILSSISKVPAVAVHRQLKRVQVDSSPARIRRRAMRRHGLDEATALQRIPDAAAKQSPLPFVVLGSRSTGQPSFRLFLDLGPLLPEAKQGVFNSYGLSQQATTPWF